MDRHIAEFVPGAPDRRSEPREGSFDRRAVRRAIARVAVDPALAGADATLDWDLIAEEIATDASASTCGYPIEI